jgi:peptidyl-prolyl cis-trans isomerase C/peptidyl-prolyl cis-trans isomerase D
MMRKKPMNGLFICLILMIFSATAYGQVIATVGKKKITVKEFNKKYDQVKNLANAPSKDLFLEDLIRYEIGVQEAEKRKLDRDPIVQELIRQQLYKSLLEKELSKKVKNIRVSSKEMKAHYRRNPEIRTSHILFEHRKDATPKQIAATKKRAQEIFVQVRKSKRPFGELAKLYSDNVLNKNVGGDVGWQNRITLVPNYYSAIKQVKTGRIVPKLIRTKEGFHIVKVTGRRSFEDADKSKIRAAVFEEKRKGLFDDFFKKLKSKYKISVNKRLVK